MPTTPSPLADRPSTAGPDPQRPWTPTPLLAEPLTPGPVLEAPSTPAPSLAEIPRMAPPSELATANAVVGPLADRRRKVCESNAFAVPRTRLSPSAMKATSGQAADEPSAARRLPRTLDRTGSPVIAVRLSLDPPIRECGSCFPDAGRVLGADADVA